MAARFAPAARANRLAAVSRTVGCTQRGIGAMARIRARRLGDGIARRGVEHWGGTLSAAVKSKQCFGFHINSKYKGHSLCVILPTVIWRQYRCETGRTFNFYEPDRMLH